MSFYASIKHLLMILVSVRVHGSCFIVANCMLHTMWDKFNLICPSLTARQYTLHTRHQVFVCFTETRVLVFLGTDVWWDDSHQCGWFRGRLWFLTAVLLVRKVQGHCTCVSESVDTLLVREGVCVCVCV